MTCLCIYHSGLYTGLFAIVSLPLFIFPQKLPECFCLPRCPMGKNSRLFIASLPSEIFVPNLGACCPMQRALAFLFLKMYLVVVFQAPDVRVVPTLCFRASNIQGFPRSILFHSCQRVSNRSQAIIAIHACIAGSTL